MSKDTLQDDRRRPFYMIDNDIIDKYGAQIGAYGVAVYNLLARYASNQDKKAFPSYQTIANKLGMSRRKVIETIALLIDAGLIHKDQRFDEVGDAASNTYTLADLGGGSAPHAPPSAQSAPPSAPETPQVVHHMHQGSALSAPYKDLSTKTNERKSENTPRPVLAADLRKTINGRIPEGTGLTPVEVFYEVWSTKEESLTNYKRDEMTRIATDLTLWRQVVKAWALKYKSSHNIEGMLDWYRNGIPKYTNGSRPAQEVDLNYLLNQGSNQ